MNASQDSTGDRTPGFVGLLAAGYTPAEAWQVIRDDLAAHPQARAVIDGLRDTPDGEAALDCSRAMWGRHGLPAPFDNLPG